MIKTILIVDDSKPMRDLVSFVLEATAIPVFLLRMAQMRCIIE